MRVNDVITSLEQIVGDHPSTSSGGRYDPRAQLLWLGVMVALAFVSKSWWYLLILLLVNIFFVFFFAVPWARIKPLVRLNLYILGFCFSFQVLFNWDGPALVYLIPRVSGVGPFWPITTQGLYLGVSMSLRYADIILPSIVFSSVVRFKALLLAFTSLGVPYQFGYMALTALRFIPVLMRESVQIQQVQRLRGLAFDRRGLRHNLTVAYSLAMPLLVNCVLRARNLSLALESRGFNSHPSRTVTERLCWQKRDSLLVVFLLLLVITSLGLHWRLPWF
ncbi:MAG: energy-coupling factor transporter transmembrane component T [Clostridia bacterium]|jgi:energy-coupling factor transport system permease protein|nr:energy-coupling factor transporter transmembrane protein EcfT [Clostridia bacterium]MDH7573787.1 energy-coupling factor transporter transmembrane component T [Clostridia bacterium]